jgi:DNA-binding beta-propeller fold protein YncE
MMKINKSGMLGVLLAAFAASPLTAQVPPNEFVNFEGAQTHPMRISSDGTRLFALNTPNGTLSVFDLTVPSSPALIAEIPVGIEPVSVNINPNVAGNNEAWVTNQISNSVSVVSVSQGIVTNTIYAKAEPSDVVFAKGNAFVSIARSNLVNVYNASTHALVQSIPLTGEEPRALALSPDGSTVYVAFALSGNHTTIVPATKAPPQSPPVNPALPAPPQVGLIVDASEPAWYPKVIQYTMPDNDVAAISTSTYAVTTYYPHLGTVNLGLAVNPTTGFLYVANTDALNTINFETALNGHFVNHQITSVNPANGQTQIFDLNPNINYSQLQNPSALATALATPTGVTFEPTGRYLYIAAFSTDRVAIFDTSVNAVSSFIEIDPQAIGAIANPASKRGPRGLALSKTGNVLYVLNRISNTISIVNLSNNTVSSEIATGSFDPTPVAIRNGRGFLYDAKLSGNGTGACASCHIDAEMDLLAWNLGNPDGDMTYLYENETCCSFHPMKGPMTTQSLRGLNDMEPYHWRGDKPDFAAFNGAFAQLMGGSQLSDADMTAFTNFINTIVYQPNPNLNLDGTYPATIELADVPGVSASPLTGQGYFLDIVFNPVSEPGVTCSFCHASDPLGSNGVVTGTGTNLNVRIPTGGGPGAEQPFKIPHLRNMYQKLNQNFNAGAVSVNGFGFNHDGAITGLFAQAGQTTFGSIATGPASTRYAIDAFEMCFPTGTAPAVGYSRTLNPTSVNTSPAQTDWTTLQSQAMAGAIDLIANGTIQGQVHGLLYQPASNNYETDTTGLGPFTQAQLTAFVVAGDTLTLMGVPPGSGNRMALDMNLDGHKNGDQHRRLATRLISATH